MMDTCNALVLSLLLVIFSDISRALSINKFDFDASITLPTPNMGDNLTPQLPPLIFPNDPKTYRIVPTNDTALKILQHKKSLQEDPTSTLKPQLQRIVSDSQGVSIFRVTNMHVDDIPEEFPSDIDIDLKGQFEDIQPIDPAKAQIELEERFHPQPSNLQEPEVYAGDIETGQATIIERHIPAILAGVLAAVCFGVCASVLCWRSYIERKYGKRERLINQDDSYPSDLRHIDVSIE